jgi:hypothetical protein
VASSSRQLRAASARSACGGPQVTGWFMGSLYGRNITGVKSA